MKSIDIFNVKWGVIDDPEELRFLMLALSKFLAQPYQLRWNVSWNGDSFDTNILEHAA